jgi:hypothetical protein
MCSAKAITAAAMIKQIRASINANSPNSIPLLSRMKLFSIFSFICDFPNNRQKGCLESPLQNLTLTQCPELKKTANIQIFIRVNKASS